MYVSPYLWRKLMLSTNMIPYSDDTFEMFMKSAFKQPTFSKCKSKNIRTPSALYNKKTFPTVVHLDPTAFFNKYKKFLFYVLLLFIVECYGTVLRYSSLFSIAQLHF